MAGSAGETTGLSLAEVILLGFEGIKEADKLAFFNYIATSMNIDSQAVCTAFDPYEREPTKDRYRRYMAVSEPRRQEFIPRLNQVPGATGPQAAKRSDLLRLAAMYRRCRLWTWISGTCSPRGATGATLCCGRSICSAPPTF